MILCQHGCGKPAIHITKGSLGSGPFKGAPVHQCATSANSCQAVKDRKVASSLAKYGTNYPWQTKEVIETRNQTNIEKYGHVSSIMNPTIQAKRKKTMLDRYGVEEPTQNEEIRKKAAAGVKRAHADDPELVKRQVRTRKEKYGEDCAEIVDKIRATQVANGRWVDPALRSEWTKYKRSVDYHTYWNYKKFKHIINPNDLPLGHTTYQLDHIYSRKTGFENKVDPKIIGHQENLRVIPASDNRAKSYNCDITLEELMVKTKGA
jgi:hypothetical protein